MADVTMVFQWILSGLSFLVSLLLGFILKQVIWETLKDLGTKTDVLEKTVHELAIDLAAYDHLPNLFADIKKFQEKHLELHDNLSASIEADRRESIKIRERWIPRIELLEENQKEIKKSLNEILGEIKKLSNINRIIKGSE